MKKKKKFAYPNANMQPAEVKCKPVIEFIVEACLINFKVFFVYSKTILDYYDSYLCYSVYIIL